MILIKIIAIIAVLIVFAIVFKYYVMKDLLVVEKQHFTNIVKPVNTRIAYYNISDYPWDRHSINSSIPYDVKVKEDAKNAFYYEFDNDTYDKKLKEVFKSPCEELVIATEGSKWSKWINPKKLVNQSEIDKLVRYYNVILSVIYKSLNENTVMDLPGDTIKRKIQIVHDIMNRYRYNQDNTNYLLFDIDMIFYREGKLQGKHIKIFAITNGVSVNVIAIKVIGVISEDNIVLFPYVGSDATNKLDFDIFIPEGRAREMIKRKKIDSLIDTNVSEEVENIMYKKLLEEYDYEDDDISNNTYDKEKEMLYRPNNVSDTYDCPEAY